MNKSLLLLLSLCSLCLLIASGCGGSSTPHPVISVALTPNSALALDANQSDSLMATVTNDSGNHGVTWTVTCSAGAGACGAMAQAKSASGVVNQYVAPANVSTAVIVSVIAVSVGDPSKSASVNVTVNPALALVSPAPQQPQPGLVGVAFSFNLANFVQGGTVPFTWAIKSGTLPGGLALDSKTGMITGTPTAATTAAIVIAFACTDSGNPATTLPANLQISLTINKPPALKITSGPPPNGIVGATYSVRRVKVCDNVFCTQFHFELRPGFPLTATGGVPPYTWVWTAAQGSSLPPGLLISATTSSACGPSGPQICGKPQTVGTYDVVVTVKDSASPQGIASTPYTIIISNPPPPTINTTPPPSAGAVNLPYSFSFTASNGLAPLVWSETGSLPPGLVLSNAGVLSGTPTVVGSSPVTLMVQDSVGQSATPQDFAIQIFAHGFKATGSMAAMRVGATATLLNDGKLLVTGGEDAPGHPLATAELFDPTTGTFTSTSSMGTARVYHAAILLADGKVLVLGGANPSGMDLTTAELFDPASATFSPTGSMHALHGPPTLLNDGKVLVAGGVDENGNTLSTAELFDPTSGTFGPTGSMVNVRQGGTATLLKNGKVLVIGGSNGSPTGGILATAEIYDPASGSFAPTGSMAIARVDHTANLLNSGKVLVTGGLDNGGNALTEAELFDPASGSFSATGSMQSAHWVHLATLLSDGTVLVTGGRDSSSRAISTAELFDPANGTFAPTGSMTTARELHKATLLNDGRVLVTGGSNGSFLATAELYQ